MKPKESKITAHDLLDTLEQADALKAFLRLPPEEQENFSRWIGKSRDDESHWRRIHAVVLAMRMGPLQNEAAAGSETKQAG